MIVGIPKERRPFEFRVGLPPAGVAMFAAHGHQTYVESGAGVGAGFTDQDYAEQGAVIAYSDEEVFGRADLLLKFTRPLMEELEMCREGQALAGFMHLAATRQDSGNHFFDRGLAVAAAQPHHRQRELGAPVRGQFAQYTPGIADFQQRQIHIPRCADGRRRGAALTRLMQIIVTVETGATQRHEQVALRQSPSVGADAAEGYIRTPLSGIEDLGGL